MTKKTKQVPGFVSANRKKYGLFIAASLLISISLLMLSFYIDRKDKEIITPLRMPLRLVKGVVYEAPITLAKEAFYSVELMAENVALSNQMRSLFGSVTEAEEKATVLKNEDSIDIDWEISDKDILIETYKARKRERPTIENFGDVIARGLGGYNHKGDKKTYIFRAKVNESVPRLDAADLHLQMRIHPYYIYSLWGNVLATQFLAGVFLVLASVGCAMFIKEMVVKRCGNCGSRMRTNKQYCGKCGVKI